MSRDRLQRGEPIDGAMTNPMLPPARQNAIARAGWNIAPEPHLTSRSTPAEINRANRRTAGGERVDRRFLSEDKRALERAAPLPAPSKFPGVHMRALLFAVLAGFCSTSVLAAGSTIQPAVPANNAPMASAPIRGNFAAAYADINALIKDNAGISAPVNPVLGQKWLNTSSTPFFLNEWDGSNWVALGSLNATTHLWSVTSTALGGSYPGITGVGTLTAGTWNATPIGTQFGGLGANNSAATGVPVFSAGTATVTAATGSGAPVLGTGPTLSGATLSGTTTLPGSGQISSAGRFGIGMTPSNILDITQSTSSQAIASITNPNTAGQGTFEVNNGTSRLDLNVNGTARTAYGVETAGSGGVYMGNAQTLFLAADGGGPITFGTGTSIPERMRLDSSGRLGLGTSSPAWNSTYSAIDINATGGFGANNSGLDISANTYFGPTNWVYKTTGFAEVYQQSGGVHSWYVAPSGTAGTATTLSQEAAITGVGQFALNGSSSGIVTTQAT